MKKINKVLDVVTMIKFLLEKINKLKLSIAKYSSLYVFNEQSLRYEKVNIRKFAIFLYAIAIFVGSIIFCCILGNYYKECTCDFCNIEFETITDAKLKDSIFREYERRADLYLSQDRFKNTPIKGYMLAQAAKNAYELTGVLLPVELALAQAQFESDMGRLGRSPATNPFNIGEWDTITVRKYKTTFDGIQAYYYIMCADYLNCKSVEELLKNFSNCQGYRYATDEKYEVKIMREYLRIKEWINKKIKMIELNVNI